jgi:hypothetical protein
VYVWKQGGSNRQQKTEMILVASAPKFNSRAGTVLGATAILALSAGSGAVAAGLVTSADIKDFTIQSRDMRDGAITSSKIRDGGVHGNDLSAGVSSRLGYTGAEWSIVDRNTIGNGDAFLRAGPSAANFGSPQEPPLGDGSLGLRTGSPDDKAVFGNQTDFVDRPLSEISTVEYSVFTTNENRGKSPNNDNLPNVQFEVNPHTTTSYSTLTFVPEAQPYGWSDIDASTAQGWYYTGTWGASTACNQTTYCTLEDAKAEAPNATIHTVQISKGRDYAFSGAVDALTINDTTYDFEPLGVRER